MGKQRENIGKLVEEDGKNIQLFTKVAKIFQTRCSPFSSMFPHFSSGMLLTTSPPRGQQKVVFGAFHAMLSPFFSKTLDNSHRRTHFPPFPPISPFSLIFPQACCSIQPPPPTPKGQRKVVFWAFHAMLSPFFHKTSENSHSKTHFPPFFLLGAISAALPAHFRQWVIRGPVYIHVLVTLWPIFGTLDTLLPTLSCLNTPLCYFDTGSIPFFLHEREIIALPASPLINLRPLGQAKISAPRQVLTHGHKPAGLNRWVPQRLHRYVGESWQKGDA